MPAKTRVDIQWFKLGRSLNHVVAAGVLTDETAGFTANFRKALRQNPEAFDCTIEVPGFAREKFCFRSLCQTVALIEIPPHNPARSKLPDALCLMVNGLEGPQDVALVKARVKLPPHVWNALTRLEKPVTIAAFRENGRMRNPVTVTAIMALSNVYFNMFGTNALADRD